MAFVKIPGSGMWLPKYHTPGNMSYQNLTSMDATGEKLAIIGRFKHPSSGTKDVSRVQFRFGTGIVKTGGSALIASLQDVSAISGPPAVPDEVQDQTVTVPNVSIVANSWHRSGVLSANRTLQQGELVAFVLEFDASGRLGSDLITLSTGPMNLNATRHLHQSYALAKTSGSWGSIAQEEPILILECSDGTYGSLEGCFPTSSVGATGIHTGTTPDEIALKFAFPFPCKIDGLSVCVNSTSVAASFQVVLYDNDGSTALATISIDPNQLAAVPNNRSLGIPINEIELIKDEFYYLAIKPDQGTNNVNVYAFTVNDAAHMNVHDLGSNAYYTSRSDGGAWTDDTTQRPFFGVRVSSLDDGVSGGGGSNIYIPVQV